MNLIGQLLASMWSLFQQINVPVLGIKFSTLYLGIFAVGFSIQILGPLIGIGRNFTHNRPIGRKYRQMYNRNNKEE